jgi:hypothetical protein
VQLSLTRVIIANCGHGSESLSVAKGVVLFWPV